MDRSDIAQPIIAKSAGAENKKKRNNRTFDALPYKTQAFPSQSFLYFSNTYSLYSDKTNKSNQLKI